MWTRLARVVLPGDASEAAVCLSRLWKPLSKTRAGLAGTLTLGISKRAIADMGFIRII